jgi:uncharacterized protein
VTQEETVTADEPVTLIDHHVHGVVTAALDRAGFEQLMTESPLPAPAGTTAFDSQLGFAVLRWCAPLLDLEPHAPPEEYLWRRTELGTAEVNRRLLTAASVSAWLVDTGYQPGLLTTPEEMAAVSLAPARPVIRLESVAESVLRSGTGAAGFAAEFAATLADETAAGGAVGYKSIAAYRFGLDFGPARPDSAEVTAAASRALRALEAGPATRVGDEVLLRHLIWTAVDTRLPLQFHTGFGDPDIRLHRANPSLLHDFLLATQHAGAAVMLLHCYPFHREAGYLASVFPHVYMDVGEIINHAGARSASILAEALELTPFHKMLYSSDAFGLPELHYLGALGFRRDLARVTSQFVADGAWSPAGAARVGRLIGSGNAARVYRLGTTTSGR